MAVFELQREVVVFILLCQGFGVTGRRRVRVDAFIGVDECRLANADWRVVGKGEEGELNCRLPIGDWRLAEGEEDLPRKKGSFIC